MPPKNAVFAVEPVRNDPTELRLCTVGAPGCGVEPDTPLGSEMIEKSPVGSIRIVSRHAYGPEPGSLVFAPVVTLVPAELRKSSERIRGLATCPCRRKSADPVVVRPSENTQRVLVSASFTCDVMMVACCVMDTASAM